MQLVCMGFQTSRTDGKAMWGPSAVEDLRYKTELAYFALCRPLIRESGLINRWQKGDRGQAKCVSCNQCRVRHWLWGMKSAALLK